MAVSSYKHGVTWRDVPTSIVAPVKADSGIPIIIGAAPVHMAISPAPPNTPRVYMQYEDAVREMGFSKDFNRYGICEAMYVYFALFNTGPIICSHIIEADDPRFQQDNPAEPVTFHEGVVHHLSRNIIPKTLEVKDETGTNTYQPNLDYTGSWDREGYYNLLAVPGGALDGSFTADVSVMANWQDLAAQNVTSEDIIGGVDVNTGKNYGLEVIEDVFPLHGIVPGCIMVPGWAQNPEVAAVATAKADDINGCFRCIALVDINSERSTQGVLLPTGCYKWKNDNNYTEDRQYTCWPRVGLTAQQSDGTVKGSYYWLSTEMGARIEKTDHDNGDVPVETPSNKLLKMNGTYVGDVGKEEHIIFSKNYGDMLNGQGIATAINWRGGWKAWGNNMACYPDRSTDPKDRWISSRRMTDYVGNTLVLTIFQFVDRPANRRLIDQIVDTSNVWLNGLVSAGQSLGARVEFNHAENPDTEMIDGHYLFHVYEFFPIPAEWIEFVLELDISYLSVLFEPATTTAA
jgi:uncharacterized protein